MARLAWLYTTSWNGSRRLRAEQETYLGRVWFGLSAWLWCVWRQIDEATLRVLHYHPSHSSLLRNDRGSGGGP